MEERTLQGTAHTARRGVNIALHNKDDPNTAGDCIHTGGGTALGDYKYAHCTRLYNTVYTIHSQENINTAGDNTACTPLGNPSIAGSALLRLSSPKSHQRTSLADTSARVRQTLILSVHTV